MRLGFLKFLTLIVFTALMSSAYAQRTFAPRFSKNTKGDIAFVSNSLMTCNTAAAGCTALQNTSLTGTSNNNYVMQYINTDATAGIFSSSSAQIVVPAGSVVEFAGLYWAGDSANIGRSNVLFKTPSSSAYVTVSAATLDTFTGTNVYQGFANVTSLVAASAGNMAGNYTVANVQSRPGASNVYAGWTLVVAYSNTTLPMRNLSVYDGYQRVNSGTAGGGINISLSGFLTPPVGPVNTSVGTIAYDGDRRAVEGTAGLQFGPTATSLSPVFNAVNPQNDYFNSTISNGGADVLTRNPAHLNTLGYDADITRPNTPLPNGATTAVVRVSSSSETIDLGVVTLATDIFVPNVKDTLIKKVTDVNGGPVLPGDVLEYELRFGNTGQDPALEVILRDTIPANTTYLPNSIVIVSGANAGPKTDAAGDDQAEYVAATKQVVIRGGVGANASVGGKVSPGDVFTVVRFGVTVNPGTPGDTVIDNFGVLTSKAQTLGTVSSDTSDADAAQPGDQPARVIVASPDLTIAKTHTGTFFAGQTGVVYNLVVSNSGQASSSGVVTVTEVPPAGLSSLLLTGAAPWSCVGLSCTRSDVLAPGASYSPITVTANVDINAPASVVNQANVSGGSEAASKTSNNSVSDPTTIVQGYPIAKSFTPSAVSTLQPSQLAITVRNLGASPINGLAITDNFPPGLVVATPPVSSSSGCGALVFAPAANATGLTATGGSVAAASTCTLVVQVVAANPGAYVNTIAVGGVTSTNAGNNNAAVSATLSVSAPDLRLAKSGSISFYKGQTAGAAFVLDVTNTGSGASTGAMTVVDTLPSGLLPLSGSGSGWSCTVAGQTLTCSRGDTLAANAAYPSITLNVSVDSSAPASITNTASVSGGGEPAGNTGNNTASFNVQVLSPVTVAKTFSPVAISLSGTSTLQITLTNPNTLTVTGVGFADAYPANLQNAATPGASTTCALGSVAAAANGNSLALSGASLAPLSSCTVQVLVGPGPAAGNGGFVNQLPAGAVTSANAGASVAAVSATLNVAAPDLTVAKSHTGTFFPGQTTATFAIIASNNGPSGNGTTVGQITVVDTLPAGLVPVSAGGTGWGPGTNSCSVAGQIVTCNRSDILAYGASYAPISVLVQVVGSGTLTNVVEVSGGAEPAANAANNTGRDTVFVLARPAVSKAFSPVATSIGAPVTLTVVVTNPNTVAITGVSFTDNYPAGIKNTGSPNPVSTCGGSPVALAGGSSLALNNATIAAGSSCSILVLVQADQTGDWTNALVAGAVSSTNAGSNATAANATLSTSAPDLIISKTHSGANFFQGQSTASFTITATNQGAGATLGAFEVTDVLPLGLTPLTAGGPGWGPQAANQCTITGQTVTCQYATSLAAGATADFNITVSVSNAAPASLVNTANIVGGNEPLSAQNNNGATDTVQIFSSPRVVKAFSPISASVGQTVTLTITLFNDNAAALTGVALTDNLPSGLATAGAFASSTCGAVTVNPTSVVLASGGIPASSSCQIVVAVIASTTGNLLNFIPAGGLTSVQAGASQVPAQATLALAAPNLTLSKSHVGNFFQGQTTATYSLVVNNVGSGSTDGSSIAVTDPLPIGLMPISVTGAGWSCGFVGQLVTCSRSAVLSGGSSTAAISVVVAVDANAPSSLLNTASVSGGGEPPSSSLDNNASDPTTIFASPVVTKAFAPSTVNINQPSVLSITIRNPNALPLSGMAFTDLYPVGLVNASVTNVQNSCGGTATPGVANISLSAGTLAANASCVVSIQVQAAAANGFTNTLNAGSVATAEAGANAVTATAVLNVAGPDLSVSKSHTGTFYKNQVGAQFRIDVRNVGLGASAGVVTVADLLPGTMVATAIAGTNWSCTLVPLQCTRSDSLAAGSVYEPIIVTVNVSDSATSSENNRAEVSGGSEPAANTANNVATDNVQILSNPSIVKSFTPSAINAGNPSELLITLGNPNAVPVTGVVFSDVLPIGLTTQAAATGTCGGTLSTLAGSVSLSAGTIAAGASCTVRVPVTGNTPGGYANVIAAGALVTANAGTNQATATAVLTIAAPDLVLTKSHAGNFYVGQTTASYTLEVRNIGAGATNGSTPVTVTDTLPVGLSYQSASGSGWTCALGSGTNVVCTHPASSPTLAVGASLPILTINVSVAPSAAASVANTAAVGGGGEPVANASNNTATDITKVLRNPAVSKSFSPSSSNINATVRLSIIISNPNDVPMTGVGFTDVYSGALINTAVPSPLSTCGGSVLAIAATNTFTLSGATIPANGSCQLEVNVLATAAGNHANTLGAGSVSSSNAGSNTVPAAAFFAAQSADLVIAKSHNGTFFQGQANAAFVLRVTNVGVSPSTGATTVTDVLPSGMTLVSMSGANWTCIGSTCARTDSLNSGQSFQDIVVTVNIDSNAGNSLINAANVINAGEPAANQGNNSDTDIAVVLRKPTISKSFSPTSMFANDVSVLTVVLSNANTVAATGVSFTDIMPAEITMASPANAVSSCGGIVIAVGSNLQLTGASIPAAASCEVRVNVSSNVPGSHVNTIAAGGLTTVNIGANQTATSAVLGISSPDLILSKSHSGSFFQGQSNVTYSLVVTNNGIAPTNGVVTVTDSLPPALSFVDAVGSIGWSCANNPPLTCTRSDPLLPGSVYPPIILRVNVASNATSFTNSAAVSGGGEAPSLTGNNSAVDPTSILTPIQVSKSFAPNPIVSGQTTTLKISVFNLNATAVSPVNITDTMPAQIIVAGPVTSSCAATVSTGLSQVVIAGVTIPGSSSCTFSIPVTASAPGSWVNTINTGDVTPNINSAAQAVLTVNAPNLTVSKTHTGTFYASQQGALFTLIASNVGNASSTGTVTVTDNLPQGFIPVAAGGTGWLCTIAGAQVSCSRADALGISAAYPAISISLNVVATASGSITNNAQIAGGGDVDASNNQASDAVLVLRPLAMAKQFAASSIGPNQTTLLTISVINSNPVAITNVGVTDVFPTSPGQMIVAGPVATNCAGSIAATAGNTGLVLSGATVAPNSSCTLTAVVTAATAGLYSNVIPAANLTSANAGNALADVSDAITISAPDLILIKSAVNAPFYPGQTDARFVLQTSNIGNATTTLGSLVTVIDNMPSGLVPTSAGGVGWNCTVVAPTVTCSRSDALGVGASYFQPIQITATVALSVVGSLTNTAQVSGGGDNNASNNSVSVGFDVLATPKVTKSFAPSTAQTGQTVLLTINLINSNAIAMTGVNFTDTFPANLRLTANPSSINTCGGVLNALALAGSVSLSGGTIPPDGCFVSVDVEATIPGVFTNVIAPGALTSANSGVSQVAASATLQVSAPDLRIVKRSNTSFWRGQQAGASYAIGVSNIGSAPTNATVTVQDTLPTGILPASVTAPGWTCFIAGQSVNCSRPGAGGDALATGASYADITIAVTVARDAPLSLVNTARVAGGGEPPSAIANNSADDIGVIFANPTVSKRFLPVGISLGQVATLEISVVNSNPASITNVALVDAYPVGLINAAVPNASSSCGGVLLATPGAGALTLTSAIISANSTCVIKVDVTTGPAAVPTALVNTINAGSVTSANAGDNPAGAAAILTVASADLVLAKTHVGSFYQSQNNATYNLQVTNQGSGNTLGTVTVSDTLPASMVPTTATGAGWDCSIALPRTVDCKRSDVLNAGAVWPSIVLTVAVSAQATSTTNFAFVSGGGESVAAASNNGANDPTDILTSPTISKSFVGGNVAVNTPVTMIVILGNSNSVPITGVAFTDVFPPNLVFAANPSLQNSCLPGVATANNAANTLALSAGVIPAGGSCSVSVQVMLTTATGVVNIIPAGALTSSNGGSNLTPASAAITGTVANLSLVKKHTGTFFAGQQAAVFSITASNVGGASTSGLVTVTDTLPPGLVLAGAMGQGWSCTAAGGQSATCTRADSLAVGAAYPDIQVSVNVAATATGTLTNVAQVVGGGDVDTSNNNATDTVVILANPSVIKGFAVSVAPINTPVTLTLVLGNINAVPLTGVELSDVFPANLVFSNLPNVQSTCGAVSTASTPTPQLRLTGGTIPANASCTISAQVMLTSASVVINTIHKNGLTTNNAGSNLVAASATITGYSTEPAGYKSVRQILDADGSGTVTPGDMLEWTVFYANTQVGAGARANFQISDVLSTGFVLTAPPTVIASGGASVATVNPAYNGTTNANLLAPSALLDAGGVIAVRIPVRIAPNTEGILSNQAVATAPSLGTATIATDAVDNSTSPSSLPAGVIVPSGSMATTQTTGLDQTTFSVKMLARIGVAKSVYQTKQINGTTIQVVYDVLVKNLGTQPAPNVQAIDSLLLTFGAPVTYVMATAPFVVSGAALPTNAAFNGGSDVRLLQGNVALPAGASTLIRFALNVKLVGSQTTFNNSAFSSSNGASPNSGGSISASSLPGGALVFVAPLGAVSTDVSNNALRGASLVQLDAAVDPSGNLRPNDAGEDVPTPVSLAFAAALRGSVWLDTQISNRQRDPGEQGVAGFGIELINATTSQTVSCVAGVNTNLGCIVMPDGRSLFATNAAGNYEVIGVPVGAYRVQFRDGANNIIYGTPINASNHAQSTVAQSRDALLINLEAGDSVLEQSLPLDPSGVVYNSAPTSRAAINGAIVTMCGPTGFNPAVQLVGGSSYTLISGQPNCASMTVGANGFYQYLLQPGSPSGQYTLAARAAGYFGPSVVLPPTGVPPALPPAPGVFAVQPQATPPTGAQSTLYYLTLNLSPGVQDVVHNHIPLDALSNARLFVTKSVNQRSAEIGDSVEYTISVVSPDATLPNVDLTDRLPVGFRLIPRTVRINGVSVNDPIASSAQQTTLNLGTLAQNIPARVQYRVRIGVGAQMGDGVNRASASATGGSTSNIAQAVVKVTGGVFTSDGCVVGKVFVDCNQNHAQDAGELGIPGVRFYLEDGTYLISDRDGKYSYCGLSHGTHVIKVDPRTLPEGSRMTTFSNRNVGDAESVLMDMRSGELLRADFVEGSCKPSIVTEVEKRRALLQPLGDDRNQEVKR